MRTITNLLNFEKPVYVETEMPSVARRFLKDAQREGFIFTDGTLPILTKPRTIYHVNHNYTITSIYSFCAGVKIDALRHNNDPSIIVIDYERYVRGEEKYFVKYKTEFIPTLTRDFTSRHR